MAKQRIIGFLCKEDYCVYLRDDTHSAALLAYHRPGGFHRLMNTSRYADWRTSSGFAQFRPEQSSVETAQSRRAVGGNGMTTVQTSSFRLTKTDLRTLRTNSGNRKIYFADFILLRQLK